jgi:hypothetical protein
MLITKYQKTDILFSVLIFPLFYYIYLYLSDSKVRIWDIIFCTFTLFIILLFKYFYINYNLLQSQNLILTL